MVMKAEQKENGSSEISVPLGDGLWLEVISKKRGKI